MLIVLVAAFNIVATLVMVVMERRKEIAILRAMGARAGSVAAIFLTEGAAARRGRHRARRTGSGFVTSWAIGKYHLIHLPADMFMVSYVPVRHLSAELSRWWRRPSMLLCLVGGALPGAQGALALAGRGDSL